MNPLPAPEPDKLTQKEYVTDPWARFFNTQSEQLSRVATRLVPPIAKVTQNASIASTAIAPNLSAAGLYWLTYYARITKVGAVSSSLTVTLNWTDHGVAQTFSGAAITGNTVTSWQSETNLVYIDASTALTYSTTYASNAANEAEYELYIAILSVAI